MSKNKNSLLKEEVLEEKKETVNNQLKASRELAAAAPDTFDYFVGCTPDSRKFYFTIGGQSYPVFTCEVGSDMSGQDVEVPIKGNVVQLTEEKVEELKGHILKKGVRFVGSTATTYFINGKAFQNNEFPAAMFIYIHRVSDLQKQFPNGGWREGTEIQTIMERDETTKSKLGEGWIDKKGEVRPLIKKFIKDKSESKEFN